MINIRPVNDKPKAQGDYCSVKYGKSVTIDVLSNDEDVEEDNITIVDYTQGKYGIVRKSGSKLIYTPNRNSYVTDSFTYTISDGNGETASATVEIKVSKLIIRKPKEHQDSQESETLEPGEPETLEPGEPETLEPGEPVQQDDNSVPEPNESEEEKQLQESGVSQ